MSFRCIKAFMHAFSGRFSRTCLEGISFRFFVCFIFNVSLGSAPKRKNFDIQRNTRVGSGGQFTLNYHTPSHTHIKIWIIQTCVKQFVSGWILFRSPCRAQPWYIFLLGLLPFLQLRFPDFVHIAAVLWLLFVFTSYIPHFIIHSFPLPRFISNYSWWLDQLIA